MKELGPTVKLLHAEVVLRSDLVRRFNQKREELVRRHAGHIRDRRARDAAADDATKSEVVFHGTLRQHVASIVRSGFVIPGKKTRDGQQVDVRCGSTWGKGML